MQLSTSGSVASAMQPQQQQVFLQSAASAGQIQLRAAAAPAQQAALQVPTAASSPAPSNVINLQQASPKSCTVLWLGLVPTKRIQQAILDVSNSGHCGGIDICGKQLWRKQVVRARRG